MKVVIDKFSEQPMDCIFSYKITGNNWYNCKIRKNIVCINPKECELLVELKQVDLLNDDMK